MPGLFALGLLGWIKFMPDPLHGLHVSMGQRASMADIKFAKLTAIRRLGEAIAEPNAKDFGVGFRGLHPTYLQVHFIESNQQNMI